MRARSLDADKYEGAVYGVENSLVGTGEPLESVPGDLDQAVFETSRQHSEKSARMLERFAGLESGVLVWTRTGDDEFRLGMIEGPWRYEDSGETGQTGICQVRSASWLPQVFTHASVPSGVAATFNRGGRNFQRIRDRETEVQSTRLWQDLND